MTTQRELALSLAKDAGFFVFPVLEEAIKYGDKEYGEKAPDPRLAPQGLKNATNDPEKINQWWTERPKNKVGVAAGASGIVVLDIDVKDGKDGYESIVNSDDWDIEIVDTFHYDSLKGKGRHSIYRDPGNVHVGPSENYRGLVGVDRRAGESYVVWVGPVPKAREITDCPDWLLDPTRERKVHEFEGDLQEWYNGLVDGKPNELVKRAIARIPEDYEHGKMVEAQHEAIRLGAEGNPGVPDLIDAIREAWMNRPAEGHSTPEGEWEFKFEEALQSGIEKFGGITEELSNLPEYDMNDPVLARLPGHVLTGPSKTRAEYFDAVRVIARELADTKKVASVLWNAPPLKENAREWGLQKLYSDIEKAKLQPVVEGENPALDERETTHPVGLLTDAERMRVDSVLTFADYYYMVAESDGFANEKYTRACAWMVASMALAFRAFHPISGTHKMGPNMWNITMGYSGTGKTVAQRFRDECLDALFPAEEGEVDYNLGGDSSVAGLHEALLQRDGKGSFLGIDEASGFFRNLYRNESWQTGLDDTLSDWYEGKVAAANKRNLKELKGKRARTNLGVQMFATPDRLMESLNRDAFNSGFLARFQWIIGDPPTRTPDRFKMRQQESFEPDTFEADGSDLIWEVLTAVLAPVVNNGKGARPILFEPSAVTRMEKAHELMYTALEDSGHWDIVEPSITRIVDALKKTAMINCVVRGSERVDITDVLVALAEAEVWIENLLEVADRVSAGPFAEQCRKIESWIRHRGGSASEQSIRYNFENTIQRSPREFDDKLTHLQQTGRLLRKEKNSRVYYELNE